MRKTFILILLYCLCLSNQCLAQEEKRNVLFLNSYQSGYAWSDDILRGVHEVFKESGQTIDLQIEFMDSRKYSDESVQKLLFDFYKYKFRNIHFEIVMVSDNFAYDFILKYQDELFPGLPVVFCGVNDFKLESLQGRKNITGVEENPDIAETLELALKLQPEKNRIVVIGDRSLTGMAIRNQIQAEVPLFKDRVPIEFWDTYNLDDILKQVSKIPPDALVFLIPFYSSDSRHVLSVNEVLTSITQNTQTPIYSSWEFMLGHGIVGGKLHSGIDEGRLAGRMALSILAGKSPQAIPIVSKTSDKYMFDYKVIKRQNIKISELPSGSELINEPRLLYEINAQVLWTVGISFIILIFILFLLIVSIFQRRDVEEKIKDQLTFLTILMDTIPIPIYYKNREGSYQGCNKAFETWFGLPRERIIGRKDAELGLGGQGKLPGDGAGKLLREVGVSILETELQRQDGELRSVILSKASYRNAKGELGGLVGAMHDVSDLKKAELTARQSREMLRLVLDNIPQLVYWKDKELRYLGVNRAFLSFFGFEKPESVIGRNDFEILSPEYAKATEDRDRQIILNDEPQRNVSFATLNSQDESVLLEINKVPLHDDKGAVVGTLSTAEDVTARHNLERQLLQSQKMEAIGTLAGGIAHDFNNILTAIINSVELALLDVPVDDLQAQDLERAIRAAQRGARLVKQILAFSRPSSEGFGPTDVTYLIREALGLIKASLPRNIEVLTNLPEGPAICLADATQLHQIILNLCTNSFQAMRGSGGKLEVSLDSLELKGDKAELLGLNRGSYLRITIADTGPGISLEIIDKIFDPFFTTKDKSEGTGLGLAVVHGIVKAHKGAVAVTSQPWEHTVFEIYLPSAEPAGEARDTRGQAVHTGQGRILFVEDDEDQLATIPRLLEQLGYEVHPVHNPVEALKLLEAEPDGYNLLLTDFDLPGISGLELAGKVAELAPDLPLILVSGQNPSPEAVKAAANIRKFLHKPYDRQGLSLAIREVLD